jgi:hypothetical protein
MSPINLRTNSRYLWFRGLCDENLHQPIEVLELRAGRLWNWKFRARAHLFPRCERVVGTLSIIILVLDLYQESGFEFDLWHVFPQSLDLVKDAINVVVGYLKGPIWSCYFNQSRHSYI